MTPASFRKIALSFPEVEERSHMAHPDFRVAGKIFATLGYPRAGWGMAVLPLKLQKQLVHDYPNAFTLATGAWGRQGSTIIQLGKATNAVVRTALIAAWKNKAPKKLTASVDLQ